MSASSLIEVYLPSGALDRTIQLKVSLENMAAAACEFPQFISINSHGDVLALIWDPFQSAAQWRLFERQSNRVRSLMLPANSRLAVPPPLSDADRLNRWISGGQLLLGVPVAQPSPIYWWALGRDVREQWTQGSFSPDEKNIVISNAVAGIVVFDVASLAVLRTLPLPRLQTDVAKPTSRPFGHLWTDSRHILVAGGDVADKKISDIWMSNVDIISGELNNVALSRRTTEIFERLGSESESNRYAIGATSAPSFMEVLTQRIGLIDRATRRETQAASFGQLDWRGSALLLNSGEIVSPRGYVINPEKGALTYFDVGEETVDICHGGEQNLWVSVGSSFYGLGMRPLGPVAVFNGKQLLRRGQFAPEHVSTVGVSMELFGHHAILHMPQEGSLVWYDLTKPTLIPVAFQLRNKGGKIIAFADKDGVGTALLSVYHRDASGGRAVWAETTRGESKIIAIEAPRELPANQTDFFPSIQTAQTGARFLVLIKQVDKKSSLLNRDEIVKITTTLYEVGESLSVRQVPFSFENQSQFDSDLRADSDLTTAFYSATGSSTNTSFVLDTRTGRILWVLPSVRAVSLTGNTILTDSPMGPSNTTNQLLWIMPKTSE